MLPDVLPMKPLLQERIWGGRGLEEFYNKALPPGVKIGESWEVSALSRMPSTIAGGPLAGWDLSRVVDDHGGELLGERLMERYGGEFPLLIKLLDARDDLSIQVHPGDDYARDHGLGATGKAEAWFVLRSDRGRIACGLHEDVDRRGLEAAIRKGRVADAVRFWDVEPGDVVFLSPGTVHTLCRGVMIYEVQQASDITFRIHDYDRPGPDGEPRELHVDEALDVIAFGGEARRSVSWRDMSRGDEETTILVESDHFHLERCRPFDGTMKHDSADSFVCLTVVHGSAEIRGRATSFTGQCGDTFLIPAGRPFAVQQTGGEPVEYLMASVP